MDKLSVLNQETSSFNASVFEDIRNMSQKGEHQFRQFWNSRLDACTISIKEPITLNSFNLPGNQSKRAAKDPIMTKKMMGILVEAAKERRQKIENALSTEVFGITQSLAKDQYSLYHGTKSHIMNPFSTTSRPNFVRDKSGVVIELSMFFRKTKPTWVHTFSDFAKFLYNEIMKLAAPFSRCDVIADRYFKGSLKDGVKAGHNKETGIVIPYNDETPIPSNFQMKFLSNKVNKRNLNEYLAKLFINCHQANEQILYITYRDIVLSNKQNVLLEQDISVCSSKEADQRII